MCGCSHMTTTTMELPSLVCVCVLISCGVSSADANERVKVKEGSDAFLPCSLSTKEDITFKLFDWRKDGQKEVFMYDEGLHYNNGRSGQDEQFKGRVSHFPDQLKNGIASIKIQKTKVADSGNYTCEFPRLQPSQTFHIELIVEPVKVVVKEGSDAILPCSCSTKENIESNLFDWKKDGQKQVFLYKAGLHYNNQPPDGQDLQFKGRVFHFQDELQHGNASIIIRNTEVADSGDYTCVFPRLQPSQTFHIELVVGATPEPSVTILGETNDGSLLQCVIRDAFLKPEVEWKDSSGNTVPAEDPHVTERGGRFDVILQTTVTKTDTYHCVATQKKICDRIDSKIFVRIKEKPEKSSQGAPTGWIVAAVLIILFLVVVVIVLLFVVWKLWKRSHKKGPDDKSTTRDGNSSNELLEKSQTSGPK